MSWVSTLQTRTENSFVSCWFKSFWKANINTKHVLSSGWRGAVSDGSTNLQLNLCRHFCLFAQSDSLEHIPHFHISTFYHSSSEKLNQIDQKRSRDFRSAAKCFHLLMELAPKRGKRTFYCFALSVTDIWWAQVLVLLCNFSESSWFMANAKRTK